MNSRLGRRSAVALMCASLLGLLAALPAAGLATSATGKVKPSTTPATYDLGTQLSEQEVQEMLAKLPLSGGSSPLSPAELAAALSHLPGLESLDVPHLEKALKESLEKVGTSVTLEEALANQTTLLSKISSTVDKLLSPLELLSLEGLLGGDSLTQKLQEALTNANANELLQRLLAHGSEGPGKTLEALLAAVPSSTLTGLLGSGLGTEPATEQTVEGLAEELGMTAAQLNTAVHASGIELPATAQALTIPLSDGQVATVLDGTSKALVGTLDRVAGSGAGEGAGEGGSKGSGSGSESGSGDSGAGGSGAGGSGSGGSGTGSGGGSGAGGAGAGGSGGSSGSSGSAGGSGGGGGSPTALATGPTVIVNLPSTPSKTSTKQPSKADRRVRVVSARVRGDVATIKIEVPSAGILTLRNKDTTTIKGRVRRAGIVKVKVRLSKAGIATARRRRHRKLRLRLRVSFKPKRGAASTAWTALLFK